MPYLYLLISLRVCGNKIKFQRRIIYMFTYTYVTVGTVTATTIYV